MFLDEKIWFYKDASYAPQFVNKLKAKFQKNFYEIWQDDCKIYLEKKMYKEN